MIKGAYSDKYKAAQEEQIERLKEQVRLEGRTKQEKVKEWSKESNRRIRALENRKKQSEKEQEKQREELLAERRKLKDEATQKFQKESLHKNKTRPSSGIESIRTGSPQLQDGVGIIRGHLVELTTRAVPTLEDALRLVNTPYQDLRDQGTQYHGPKELYQDLRHDSTKIGTFRAQNMNQGQIGHVTGLSGLHNPYSYKRGSSVATSNHSNQWTHSNHGNDGYEVDHKEQIRLRESALQNGDLKFAFTNEWTDGALPQTMGKNSPAGSLTSLDSLDEVPCDTLEAAPVTGIIVKDNRTKSAARRRVTFSDSIEFDDGLTGQLVTTEKDSCKQYVKLYNSRIAASNASNAYSASMCNTQRPTATNASLKGGIIATPGSTPMKSNGAPSSVSLQSGISASMIVPKSIYSQIPFSRNKTVATTGEVTSSSMTHTDHPVQCVAQVESRGHSVPGSHGQYGTSSRGETEYQIIRKDDEENNILEIKDSLDVMRDSLEYAGERDSIPNERPYEARYDSVIERATNKEDARERSSNECREKFEPAIHQGGQDLFRHVDYYGNPTNIYRNPFGQKISTEEASKTYNTITTTTGSGTTHALAPGSSGQHVGAGNGSGWERSPDTTQEELSKSTSKDSIISGSDARTGIKNSYHRSWYPGSFFPSKPREDKDGDMNDDRVFEQEKYTKMNDSVAYDLMDAGQESLKKPYQKNTRTNSRQMTQMNDRLGVDGSGMHKYTKVPIVGQGTCDQGTRDQETRYPGTCDPGTRDQGTCDQGTRDRGTRDRGTRDQETRDQGTRDQGTRDQGTRDQGTRDQGTRDQGTRAQGTRDQEIRNQETRYRETHDIETHDIEARDRDGYWTNESSTGYLYQQADYTTGLKSLTESKRTVGVQSIANPTRTTGTTLGEDYNDSRSDGNGFQKAVLPAGHVMTAKPPHPSTRHKGVVYSSPLHRKRAAAAVRNNMGKTSPRNAGRKANRTVVKKKEDSPERNVRSQKKKQNSAKNGRKNRSQKAGGSGSDDDEMIQSIRKDMERINMRCNSSPAQEEHQKMINSIRGQVDSPFGGQVDSPFGGHVDSPFGGQALDQTDFNSKDTRTKSDFRTVYKKVHQPIVGSAKPRSKKMTPNKVPPSKIPTYIGTSGNRPSRALEGGREDGSNNVNPVIHTTPTRWAEVSADTNELRHPQTTILKRSISLDKTPTDDEINILWDRVRNCLSHKETQSVGSDSCVNRIDVRRSQAKQFVPQGSQDNTVRDSEFPRDRSESIADVGTIGGLRRYGSHEVLRTYGSAENLGYRPQPLLQHRAQRIRQSGQGKPPMVPRQQMNLTPVSSRQAPTVSLSTRAAPIPLTQTELRAVMKASKNTQGQLFRQHYDTTSEQTQGYQPFLTTIKAPSALSIEEDRLRESIERLNERLKVTKAITANLTHKRTHSANPSTRSRPASKNQRASSSTYKHK